MTGAGVGGVWVGGILGYEWCSILLYDIGFVAVGTEALRKGIEGLFLVMEAVEVGSRE